MTELNAQTPWFNAILIDDDELVRLTWEMAARLRQQKILTFTSLAAFQAQQQQIDPQTAIYIDLELGSEENGITVSQRLHQLGFNNLYITTGHNKNHIEQPAWIKAIVGKTPPWMEK